MVEDSAMGDDFEPSVAQPSFSVTALPPIHAGSRDSFQNLFYTTELFGRANPISKDHRKVGSLQLHQFPPVPIDVPHAHDTVLAASRPVIIPGSNPSPSEHDRHTLQLSADYTHSATYMSALAQEVEGRSLDESSYRPRHEHRMQTINLTRSAVSEMHLRTRPAPVSTPSRPMTPTKMAPSPDIIVSQATPSPPSTRLAKPRLPYSRSKSMQTVMSRAPPPLEDQPSSSDSGPFDQLDDPFAAPSDLPEEPADEKPITRAPSPLPLYSLPNATISFDILDLPRPSFSCESSEASSSTTDLSSSSRGMTTSKTQTFRGKAGNAMRSLPRAFSRKFNRKQSFNDLAQAVVTSDSSKSFVSRGGDDVVFKQNASLSAVQDSFKRLFQVPDSAPPVPLLPMSAPATRTEHIIPPPPLSVSHSSPSSSPTHSRWSTSTDSHGDESHSVFDSDHTSPDPESPQCTTDEASPHTSCSSEMLESMATVTDVRRLASPQGLPLEPSRTHTGLAEPGRLRFDQIQRSRSCALGAGWTSVSAAATEATDSVTIGYSVPHPGSLGARTAGIAESARPPSTTALASADISRASSRCSSLGLDGMTWPEPPKRTVVVDGESRTAWHEVTPNTKQFISSSSPPFPFRGGVEVHIHAPVSALQPSPLILPSVAAAAAPLSASSGSGHLRSAHSQNLNKKQVVELLDSILASPPSTPEPKISRPTTPTVTLTMAREPICRTVRSPTSPGFLTPPPASNKPRERPTTPILTAPMSNLYRTDLPSAMLPAKIFVNRNESVVIDAPNWAELQAFCRANEDTIIREETKRMEDVASTNGSTGMVMLQVSVFEVGQYHVANGQADINRPLRRPRVQMALMVVPPLPPPLYSALPRRNQSAPSFTPASASSVYSTWSNDICTASSIDSVRTQGSSSTPGLTLDSSITSSSASSGPPSTLTDAPPFSAYGSAAVVTGPMQLPSALDFDFDAPLCTPGGTAVGLANIDEHGRLKSQSHSRSKVRAPPSPTYPKPDVATLAQLPPSPVERGRRRQRKPLQVPLSILIPDSNHIDIPRTMVQRVEIVSFKVPLPTLIGQIAAFASQRSVSDGLRLF